MPLLKVENESSLKEAGNFFEDVLHYFKGREKRQNYYDMGCNSSVSECLSDSCSLDECDL